MMEALCRLPESRPKLTGGDCFIIPPCSSFSFPHPSFSLPAPHSRCLRLIIPPCSSFSFPHPSFSLPAPHSRCLRLIIPPCSSFSFPHPSFSLPAPHSPCLRLIIPPCSSFSFPHPSFSLLAPYSRCLRLIIPPCSSFSFPHPSLSLSAPHPPFCALDTQAMKSLLKDCRNAQGLVTRAHRKLVNGVRVYDAPETADFWNNVQDKLGPDDVVATIILASDETMMDSRGKSKGHPIYMSLANIAREDRRKPHGHAMIALLPEFPPEYTSLDRLQVFHKVLIKAPLKVASHV
ncbi:unnamed protein product [Closterium sp. Yama58-4]|nr:unnamed protein product [Closterium sp. Yama58-4]